MNRHDIYEELAAGFALDALEPEDEALFIAHLAGCARCAADLVRHRTVAADLALAVDGVGPMPFPRHLLAEPQDAPAPIVPITAARSHRTRWLSAAAAVIVLAGVGVGGFAVGHNGRPAGVRAGTYALPLFDRTGAARGELVVKDGEATLTTSLPQVKAEGSWYVVWDVKGASATAVKGFAAKGTEMTVPLGAWQPGDVAAVSLEADGVLPEHGTRMVLTPSVLSSS
ncbi:MAG TPA: zf-HC2 domain-containing protein [Mycobacteriales bacterium]|nr:zf-HC2 domain-containing protein [Mycobacteriales bacterium]